MRHWDRIQGLAVGQFGIITTAEASRLGVPPTEMYRWFKRGWLQKVGYGVYRLASFPSLGAISDMAAILAEVGEGSYLYGESVLSIMRLCPTRPYMAFVASPARIRKKVPHGVIVVKGKKGYAPFYHDGLPCQRPDDAIRSCKHKVDDQRLMEAVDEAERQGIFTVSEADGLRREVTNA